jgi:hypothetical protein
MTIAREHVGLHVITDLQARRIYLSQAMLIDRLLDKESSGIMTREGLTGNGLRHNPGGALRKWESLCPCATPFDAKMGRISGGQLDSDLQGMTQSSSFRVIARFT